MKTLLLPIDFSAASENAINFAASWSKNYNYDRIILLKSFYTSMYENVIMAGEFANVDQYYLNTIRLQQKEQLDTICKHLSRMAGPEIQVNSAVTELPLVRSIIEVIKSENPDMILLGSDNNSQNSNEAFVSANVIQIARISPIRVLIVPAHYAYQPVQKALVPFHFNTVRALDKLNHIHASPQWKDVKLFVVNVDAKPRNLIPDDSLTQAETSLHNYLKNFQHEIYYEANKSVINGILEFKKMNEVQLLIALPGVHSFLYSLTHKSISEALYKKCRIPVMILK